MALLTASDVTVDLSILRSINLSLQTVVWAVVILAVGLLLIKLFLRLVDRALARSQLASGTAKFIRGGIKALLLTLLVLTEASQLGIPITSFVALLSVVGVAVSLAVQDGLKNIAGALLIHTARPFVLGDFVEIGDISGTVEEVGPLATRLLTIDNRRITYPNGLLTNSVIINYSSMDNRRLDIVFSIGYKDDFERAKAIIREIADRHPLALDDPEPLIRVDKLAAHSVDILCRIWTRKEDLFTFKWDLIESVKKAFDAAGISIPYNQLDVHLDPK